MPILKAKSIAFVNYRFNLPFTFEWRFCTFGRGQQTAKQRQQYENTEVDHHSK